MNILRVAWDQPFPRGTYSKIARRLNVTPTAVRFTALGFSKSARIMSELRKEARRLREKAKP